MSENQMLGNIFSFVRNQAIFDLTKEKTAVTREAGLVERVCAGEQEAFNEIYKIFAPMVHGIILARVPRDEVDDIMQEVFLGAYKKIGSLRDKNALGPWLAMIARNSTAEFYRNRKQTEELPDEIVKNDSAKTEAREILAVIRTMPDTYKETLVLRLVEGMTGQEIADKTGLTPESVRVNLHRGMKLLRQNLGINQ